MRANAVGWILVGFFVILGIAWTLVFTVFEPAGVEGPAWIGGPILIATGLLLVTIYVAVGRQADSAERLKREGIAGQAHVLEMTQTGAYVNNQPRVRFRLRVEAPGVPPFEAEQTHTVGLVFLGMLAPGRTLPIYVDRTDHARFAIDWGGTAAAPATISTQERLQQLTELQRTGDITDEEFQRQRARIIADV